MKRIQSVILFVIFPLIYLIIFAYAFIFKDVSPLELFSSHREHVEGFNLIPFKTIVAYLTNNPSVPPVVVFSNILGNILLFIPIGFYSQFIKKNIKRSFLIVFLTTFFIELFQLIFKSGTVDIDDILLNLLGGLIGILICKKLSSNFEEDKIKRILVVSELIIMALIIILIGIWLIFLKPPLWRF